jgi:hypothetical protein
VPARESVRRQGPPRPADQAGPEVPALGDARSHDARAQAPDLRERYQRNKRRLGKQRGAKVAQVDIARKLTEAIWQMLTRNEPFSPTTAPGDATFRLAA